MLSMLFCFCLRADRITQNVVKSHLETSQYGAEELKRLAWTSYTADETRCFQNKVRSEHHIEGNELYHIECIAVSAMTSLCRALIGSRTAVVSKRFIPF